MKGLLFLVVLILVGIAGFGFYRGWFGLSTDTTDHKPSATITVDRDKIQEDKDKVEQFAHKATEKSSDRTDKVKEPERRP
jgi:hypothetical protein